MDAVKYVMLSADAVEVLVNELRAIGACCRPGDILVQRLARAVETAFDKGSVSVAMFDAEALSKAIESGEPRRYGAVEWTAEDVRKQVRDTYGEDASISDDDCDTLLSMVDRNIEEVMVERGWSVLEQALTNAVNSGTVSVNNDDNTSVCAKCGVRFVLDQGNPVHRDPELTAADCEACDRDHDPYSL